MQRAVCRLLNPFPPAVKRVLGHQRSSRVPLKTDDTPYLSDFARYSIWLRFSDQRIETRLEILRGDAVETMVDFSGID
jgi:hypothetical protein